MVLALVCWRIGGGVTYSLWHFQGFLHSTAPVSAWELLRLAWHGIAWQFFSRFWHCTYFGRGFTYPVRSWDE
ncbi:hypothetical protein K505DRAFT_95393 [Melanomma pulvis-pyrius CBS 109.77]|uniref:Uncharacterized protein n=1 Tax=Melanomma pulvis-pyrius CBS 109.77 TaxID=1314802 RepID=A0A6A6WZP9_9PLEO|nr:hypothetical protein K505DRAFT_95393 [Melanomma pulvis-pyrius CBS 109.77]